MLSLLLCAALSVGLDTLPPDGPYLFYENDELIARWVDTEARTKGEVAFTPENYASFEQFESFRPELVDIDRTFELDEETHFTGVDRVVALSDIHGQYQTAVTLLRKHKVIDEDQNWIFGNGHLVIVGDIFDRGDQVTELLWLVHNLQILAERDGGQVHFLLGNHETMSLEGDDRYLNKRYRITSGMTGKFYWELYGPDTYLGRWLRTLPLAISINNTIYIHGGLSREVVREVKDIQDLNSIYHKFLIDADDLTELVDQNGKLNLLHGRQGPLWYRGYFMWDDFSDRDMEYVLKKTGASGIVVGHTSFTSIKSYFDNRLIAVDSSIKFGGVGEILIIDHGDYFRGTILGERLPLERSSTK